MKKLVAFIAYALIFTSVEGKIFEKERVDTIIDISEEESITMTKRLAREEGIFAGMSSGGAVAAGAKLINKLQEGVVVCIICDRGDRYLSSALFT